MNEELPCPGGPGVQPPGAPGPEPDGPGPHGGDSHHPGDGTERLGDQVHRPRGGRTAGAGTGDAWRRRDDQGRPDGIRERPEFSRNTWVTLECKSMSPEKVEEVRRDGITKVYPGYLAQSSLYGRALSEMREVDHRERGIFGLRLDFRPFQPLDPPPQAFQGRNAGPGRSCGPQGHDIGRWRRQNAARGRVLPSRTTISRGVAAQIMLLPAKPALGLALPPAPARSRRQGGGGLSQVSGLVGLARIAVIIFVEYVGRNVVEMQLNRPSGWRTFLELGRPASSRAPEVGPPGGTSSSPTTARRWWTAPTGNRGGRRHQRRLGPAAGGGHGGGGHRQCGAQSPRRFPPTLATARPGRWRGYTTWALTRCLRRSKPATVCS